MGIALIVPPLILVISQPDLSTTIMIFIIFCVIMFVGGINWKLVVGVLVVSVPSAAVLFNMILQDTEGKILDTYQRNRILAWIYPDQYQDSYAYQTINSVMAIGSGRLLGKGYNTNEISSLLNSGYISESQTDFIFAVIGEEFGFLGTCIVVLLVFLIALRILRIAMKASDVSGRVIAAGMAAWIGFQGFMNIAVAVGLIPNTGIPLPFVSYGLTSLLSLYLGVGFVLNDYMQSRKR
jgi:rod shape determining protein RodA